ncbi:MAG: LysR family transcriptional regulator [Gammaproteobacteria bacterium]|nr:LysR family transcriptional regulator [Gammaproteobacteria bacterium]
MKVTLKQIESFIWVADLGSFKLAAERLNTTQPNISSRISSLESTLGVVLMNRDAGSVRLTPKGEVLLTKARDVLNASDAFIVAADDNFLIEGCIRVGVTEMVANTWLNTFLDKFKAKFPNVLLELTVDLAANLESELTSSTLDLCFQSGPFLGDSSGQIEIGCFPMAWLCSSKSIYARRGHLKSQDMQNQPILTHAKNTIAFQQVSQHFTDKGIGNLRLVPSSNLKVAVEMVKDDYGIGLILEPLAEQYLQQGVIVKLDYIWTPENLRFFARYDKSRSPSIVESAAKLAQTLSSQWAKKYVDKKS